MCLQSITQRLGVLVNWIWSAFFSKQAWFGGSWFATQIGPVLSFYFPPFSVLCDTLLEAAAHFTQHGTPNYDMHVSWCTLSELCLTHSPFPAPTGSKPLCQLTVQCKIDPQSLFLSKPQEGELFSSSMYQHRCLFTARHSLSFFDGWTQNQVRTLSWNAHQKNMWETVQHKVMNVYSICKICQTRKRLISPSLKLAQPLPFEMGDS